MKLKTILFLAAFTLSINAQFISNYGLKFGVGISNQSWDYNIADINIDFDNKVEIAPRLFATFLDFSFIQMQAEVGYIQKGIKEKMTITTIEQPMGTEKFISVDNRLNYLTISALTKFRYETKMFTPYLIIGPQLNILLNKKIDNGWEVVFDKFRNNNIGISAGLGTEVDVQLPFTLLVEYRYERDLIDNYDSPNIDIKNNSHVFLLGLQF